MCKPLAWTRRLPAGSPGAPNRSRVRSVVPAAPVLALLALLAVGPRTAHAQYLSWNDCITAGQGSLTFACDRNDGAALLVGSFRAPSGITALSSIEANLDFQSGAYPLPDWWAFTSGCAARSTALSVGFDFTQLSACSDYWQGQAFGDVSLEPGYGGTNRIKMVVTGTMDGSSVGPLVATNNYYAFALRIGYIGTVGPGACAGCGAGACIAFNSITLRQVPPGSAVTLAIPSSNIVTWQPSGSPVPPDCRAATPARQATWGVIKGLYR